MKILAIDTSCDETAVAVTSNDVILSNVIWSSASQQAEFGGVMPNLAARLHNERIEWVTNKALERSGLSLDKDIDVLAVTVGNGLAVALETGINYAKLLAKKFNKPLIPINHTEAHLLSPFCRPKKKLSSKKLNIKNITLPCLGLVLSGGTTMLCYIKKIGEYKLLAQTTDDALGEALDKAARLLGFGYPGAAFMEKIAKTGDYNHWPLVIPLTHDLVKNRFSYSGLKTAFVRLFNSIPDPDKKDISDLAASFQNSAFRHIENVLEYQLKNNSFKINGLLFGGGVANNIEIRKRLRKICSNHKIDFFTPYSQKLNGDNAAMIGVCAYLKYKNANLKKFYGIDQIDRQPRMSIYKQG